MTRRHVLASLTAITLASAFTMQSYDTAAQQKGLKEQLVGVWSLDSAKSTRPDGTTFDPWGRAATGTLIYDPSGRFAFMIIRGDIPKFERGKATPEQYKAASEGVIAYHGTYTLNKGDKTITHKVEGSSFPSLKDADQKRVVTSINNDELHYINPATSFGAKSESAWKRARTHTE